MSRIEDLRAALATSVKVKPFLRRKGGQIENVAGYIREGLPGIPGGAPTIRRTPPQDVETPEEKEMDRFKSRGWHVSGNKRMTKTSDLGTATVAKEGDKWQVSTTPRGAGPAHRHGSYNNIDSAVERAEKLLKSTFRSKLLGGLSSPDGAVVNLARVFVPRHKRLTESGFTDVESYWRDLPEQVRQTIREQMEAPGEPGGGIPREPMTPGEQEVFDAVKLRVGQEKLKKLEGKLGTYTETRDAGYLKRLPSGFGFDKGSPFDKPGPGDYDREDLRSVAEATNSPEAWAMYDEQLDIELNQYLEEIGYMGPVPETRAGKEYALNTGQPDLAAELESQTDFGQEEESGGRLPATPPGEESVQVIFSDGAWRTPEDAARTKEARANLEARYAGRFATRTGPRTIRILPEGEQGELIFSDGAWRTPEDAARSRTALENLEKRYAGQKAVRTGSTVSMIPPPDPREIDIREIEELNNLGWTVTWSDEVPNTPVATVRSAGGTFTVRYEGDGYYLISPKLERIGPFPTAHAAAMVAHGA